MTAAAWLHGKVKVGLPDGAELRCTSSVFETHRNGKGSRRAFAWAVGRLLLTDCCET
jgi:hypothetical protein